MPRAKPGPSVIPTVVAQPAGPKAQAPAPSQLAELVLERAPARGREDDGVPQALQGQHDGAREVEGVACPDRVDERVDAVDAARRPGDEDGNGEDERGAQVGELDGVEVGQLAPELAPRLGRLVQQARLLRLARPPRGDG